jgi:flagellar basal-body rod modification protein FlgD
MSSTAISAILASTATSTSAVNSSSKTTTDQDDFMTLLLAELQNQDPMEPMDSAAMMSQLAQLNSLTALNAIKESLIELNKSQAMTYAASLIGKVVAYPDPEDKTKYVTGLVEATTTQNNETYVQVNGQDIEVSTIVGVTEG